MDQLTLNDAATSQALKAQGLDAVSVHGREFLKIMRATAQRISEESGFVTIENLRVVADTLGLTPHHPNAYGAIFRGKHWRMIGRKHSAIPSAHAREIKIWEWVDKHEES